MTTRGTIIIQDLVIKFYQNKNTYSSYNHIKNKEKRYSRVPRLSDTRYSAKGTKGK